MPLVVQTGIWKPATLDAALSIRTTFTPPSQLPPYADDLGDDGLVRYKWRGIDPQHSDNRAQRASPLVYFVGVDRSVYVPPVPGLVGERGRTAPGVQRRGRRRAAAVRAGSIGGAAAGVHPPADKPAVAPANLPVPCVAGVRGLLRDVPATSGRPARRGAHPSGHAPARRPCGPQRTRPLHAAYDRNILGVRPDLHVEVQPRVLAEIDGPMLRHGLQEMAGVRLLVPRRQDARPDRERLEERYKEFRAVG